MIFFLVLLHRFTCCGFGRVFFVTLFPPVTVPLSWSCRSGASCEFKKYPNCKQEISYHPLRLNFLPGLEYWEHVQDEIRQCHDADARTCVTLCRRGSIKETLSVPQGQMWFDTRCGYAYEQGKYPYPVFICICSDKQPF